MFHVEHMKEIGPYAFWLGVILAAIAPFVPAYIVWIAVINFILGLIIGFVNIEAKETEKFLLASAAFMLVLTPFTTSMTTLATAMGPIAGFMQWLTQALTVFGWMIAPAAFIVAAKQIVELAKD